MEVSGGAIERDWRVPQPCKRRQGCDCHCAAPGDPQGLNGCTGRAVSSIATVPSAARALSPAHSTGTDPVPPHPAQVEPHVPAPQRLNPRLPPPAALRHVPPRRGGIPARGAARRDGLRPSRLPPKPGEPQRVLGAAERRRSLQDRTALQGRAVLRQVSAAALRLLALKRFSGAGAVGQQL